MPAATHLFMVRPHLEGVPPVSLPAGATLRAYQPGDERAWLDIIRRGFDAHAGDDAFERRISQDEAFRPERVFFAVRSGRPVGTAAAWQKIYHGEKTGYVHMLAVVPEERRQGLGAALLRTCLHYFRRQGWRDAVLDTETTRLDAVRLYLAHGFQPLPENETELENWRKALSILGRSDLALRPAAGRTRG